MEIIFVLIALSILLAVFFLFSFIWATKSGQYEDVYGPAVRMLFDDEDEQPSGTKAKNKN